MQQKTINEIARFVNGNVCGDGDIAVTSAATLSLAKEGDISFLSNPKYTNQLSTTKASAVLISKEVDSPTTLIVVDDPYFAFREVVVLLYGQREHPQTGISSKASIASTAKIGSKCNIYDNVVISEKVTVGDNCVLYPGVFIGEQTRIGNDCILYPNAVIYNDCIVGNSVIIHANATIGEDGFGFATHKGKHHKIPHIGKVVLEDDVEIGSNCAVERGTLDDTVIGKGSKIGDSVAIGHGTKIGPYCLLVPQVGISGSTTLGHHCICGGQVGIAGHINIGNSVIIGAQAGVTNDVQDGKIVLGAPAIDANKAKRAYRLIQYLPEMRKAIKDMEQRLSELESEDSE